MVDSIQKVDLKILDYINRTGKNKMLNKSMPCITALGNYGFIWVVMSLYLLSSRIYKGEGLRVLGALALTSFLGEGIIKHIVRRRRPFDERQKDELLISKPQTYSFPSGHTASSFAAAGIFYLTGNPLSMHMIILAFLISFSRLYLRVHFFSDILGGVLLGISCSLMIVKVF
ncbi:MAG: phosphatase PAP2 family protein [Clostridiaceae bacterium]